MKTIHILVGVVLSSAPLLGFSQAPSKAAVDISKASPKKQSEKEAIDTLNALIEKAANKTNSASGACIYSAGSSTKCAVLSLDYCNQLKGSWYEGQKCPGT